MSVWGAGHPRSLVSRKQTPEPMGAEGHRRWGLLGKCFNRGRGRGEGNARDILSLSSPLCMSDMVRQQSPSGDRESSPRGFIPASPELPHEVSSSALVIAREKSSFSWSVFCFVMSSETHAPNGVPGKHRTDCNLSACSAHQGNINNAYMHVCFLFPGTFRTKSTLSSGGKSRGSVSGLSESRLPF